MENYYALCVLETESGDNILAYADSYNVGPGQLAEISIAGEPELYEVVGRYNSVTGECIKMLEDAGLVSEITCLYSRTWNKDDDNES